ncbi:hypothetical protein SDC9_109819 [bioreactor metagenome]|uniref:Uncharacterized protein n=1 Tax=bioreactor metagenome TaxID=1076179 RepID=A0A645BE61_9ZZZZ
MLAIDAAALLSPNLCQGFLQNGSKRGNTLVYRHTEVVGIGSVPHHTKLMIQIKQGKIVIGNQKILNQAEGLTFLHQKQPFFHRVNRYEKQIRIILSKPFIGSISLHHGYLSVCQLLKISDIPNFIACNDCQGNGQKGFGECK